MDFDGYMMISKRFITEALTLLEPALERGTDSIILRLPEDDDGFAPLLQISILARDSDIE